MYLHYALRLVRCDASGDYEEMDFADMGVTYFEFQQRLSRAADLEYDWTPSQVEGSRAALSTDPPVVRAILLHLDLPHWPPPLSPARGPPQVEFLTDPSPAFDPSEPVPVPEFEFDQSVPDDFDFDA
ncbi:MAG TPA: hypothetical protein VM198_08225 [Longimicrobiales bacterium]|nr:hypothetical protein [Longimicrobiales bacterium]